MGRSQAMSQADVAATALVAVAACAAAAAGVPAPVMIVLGIALFAAPGYLLGQLLLGSRTAGLERVAVMAALALAVPILGGLLLYVARVPLHRSGWLGLLAGVTLAADTALFLRRRHSGVAPVTWRPTWRAPGWHAAAFAAAILVAACGVGLASAGVARQPQPGFTELWLSPPQDARILNLGVRNDQGRTTSYRVVVMRDGRAAATWNLTLGNGRTWQRPVPFTGQGILTAVLYRLPDVTHPYRFVSTGTPRTAGP
jgi:hypothetical protein